MTTLVRLWSIIDPDYPVETYFYEGGKATLVQSDSLNPKSQHFTLLTEKCFLDNNTGI